MYWCNLLLHYTEATEMDSEQWNNSGKVRTINLCNSLIYAYKKELQLFLGRIFQDKKQLNDDSLKLK
jgi:hypothetical protein